MTFLIRADYFNGLPEGLNGRRGGWDTEQGYADWDLGIRMAKYGGNVIQLRGEYLWNRTEHRNSGSWLMDDAACDAALRQLRAKHSAMARP